MSQQKHTPGPYGYGEDNESRSSAERSRRQAGASSASR